MEVTTIPPIHDQTQTLDGSPKTKLLPTPLQHVAIPLINLAAKFDGIIEALQVYVPASCITAPPPPITTTRLLDDPTFHWVLIGAGGGLGVLLCLIIVSCSTWCFLLHRKSRHSSQPPPQSLPHQYSQLQFTKQRQGIHW